MLSAVTAWFVSIFNGIDGIATAVWNAPAPVLIPLSVIVFAGTALSAVRAKRARR